MAVDAKKKDLTVEGHPMGSRVVLKMANPAHGGLIQMRALVDLPADHKRS